MNDELELFAADHDDRGRRPGDVLELTALWALAAAPARLEARLYWASRGKGEEDVEVVATQQIAAPAAAGEHRFRFTLPEGPYSFAGKLVSLQWGVELLAEAAVARWEFVLGPEGREIRSHARGPR